MVVAVSAMEGEPMKLWLIAVLVTLLASGSAWGRHYALHDLWTDAETREERVLLASDIRLFLHVDKFLDVIPHLSPNEEKWLKREISSTDGNRVMKAMNSDEFVIHTARNTIEFVNLYLNSIVQDEANEFRHWVHLAYILMDYGDTEYVGILCERDIVNPCPLGPDGGRVASRAWTGMFAKKIVLGVLGPKFGAGFGK